MLGHAFNHDSASCNPLNGTHRNCQRRVCPSGDSTVLDAFFSVYLRVRRSCFTESASLDRSPKASRIGSRISDNSPQCTLFKEHIPRIFRLRQGGEPYRQAALKKVLQMAKKNYTFEALGLVANGDDRLLSNITHLAARLLRAPVSLVSVIQTDRNRQYVSAACGLSVEAEDARQVPLDQSVCKFVYHEKKLLIIEDLLEDGRTKDMQSVMEFGFRSYIGMPIHSVGGKVIGVICCIKTEPGEWSTGEIDSLERLAIEVDDIIKSRAHALELETTNSRLKKLLAARSSFTAHLSHEIRTPLTGLVGSIRLLNSLNLSGKAGELVQVLNRSSTSLLEIVNDALYSAKLDAGKFQVSQEPCDLGQLVRDIVASYRAAADEKGLTIRIEDQLTGLMFMADRRAVFSVVQNLFNNAIKFTDNGSAEIELSTDAYGSVQIKVKDTGIGIEDQSLATIFEEFQQANPRIARQHGGTGLGMAIVKRLVEAMDGELTVQSELCKGTTFTVSLPLEAIAPVSSQADTRAG